MQTQNYDVIIIGGGPAGLTAAIYASRSRLKTLLIEKMGCGGQTVITDLIENYPGFPDGVNGFELAVKFEQQARNFGAEIISDEVSSVSLDGRDKTVKTANAVYSAKTVIIASGANHKHLDVPGEDAYLGKGVSYCATCDGPFFKGKDVMVVGGGDSAVQEALYLTRFAASVTLVHRRDRLRAAKVLQERAAANPSIRMALGRTVRSINGKDAVESVTLTDVSSNKDESLKMDGVFIFVGYMPNTGFLKESLELDSSGYVVTDDQMKTSAKGVFACGDVRKKLLKQVVTACGDGATAAISAQEYIDELNGTVYK